jgi:hypothetical protein
LRPKAAPLSECESRFFLARCPEDFEALVTSSEHGAEAVMLYYFDRWRDVYKRHRDRIESEWRRRSWSRKMRRFVMTEFARRDYRLRHDVKRDQCRELRKVYDAGEGWRVETWEEHLIRLGKQHLLAR